VRGTPRSRPMALLAGEKIILQFEVPAIDTSDAAWPSPSPQPGRTPARAGPYLKGLSRCPSHLFA
jgi:hypothetical protein